MPADVVYLPVGPGALLAGVVLGALFASTPRRMLVMIALGVTVVVGLLAVLIFTSPSEQPANPDDCWECNEIWGRWFQPVIFFFALWNVIGWCLGLLAGGGLHRLLVKRRAAAA